MSRKKELIKGLIWDIVSVVIAIIHAVIGKYYSSIPPLAFVFLGISLMWLILSIVRLHQTIADLEFIFDKDKL